MGTGLIDCRATPRFSKCLYQSINQSIKTHFYSAICRERIRGATAGYTIPRKAAAWTNGQHVNNDQQRAPLHAMLYVLRRMSQTQAHSISRPALCHIVSSAATVNTPTHSSSASQQTSLPLQALSLLQLWDARNTAIGTGLGRKGH